MQYPEQEQSGSEAPEVDTGRPPMLETITSADAEVQPQAPAATWHPTAAARLGPRVAAMLPKAEQHKRDATPAHTATPPPHTHRAATATPEPAIASTQPGRQRSEPRGGSEAREVPRSPAAAGPKRVRESAADQTGVPSYRRVTLQKAERGHNGPGNSSVRNVDSKFPDEEPKCDVAARFPDRAPQHNIDAKFPDEDDDISASASRKGQRASRSQQHHGGGRGDEQSRRAEGWAQDEFSDLSETDERVKVEPARSDVSDDDVAEPERMRGSGEGARSGVASSATCISDRTLR